MDREAEWRAKASGMTDDELRNALPHAQPRKRAVYQDVLDRRAEAKADGFREREVIAVETQTKWTPFQRWSLLVAALGVLVAVVFGVLGR